jgi:ASC-1-like (ASCH) protein
MENMLVQRLNESVDFLKDNLTFKVGDFVLGTVDDETIYVDFFTNYTQIQNVSREKAVEELNQYRDNFQSMLNLAHEFYKYAKHKRVEYNLVLNTGTAGILICKDKNGKIDFFI